MAEPQDQKRTEELNQRLTEAKREAFEEESRRLDNETTQTAKELLRTLLAREQKEFQGKINLAESEQRKQEDELKKLETEIQNVFIGGQRRRTEERRIRLQEEERQRLEESERQKAEDERRRKEEELRLQLEAERMREAEEKRRQEEQQRRIELEKQQREEEEHRQQEEREKRVIRLLDNAEKYFADRDYEHALVEVAKALVNHPTHPRALELEASIREIQKKEIESATEVVTEKPIIPESKKVEKTIVTQRKRSRAPLIIVLSIAVLGVVLIVVYQLNKRTITLPVKAAVFPWVSITNSLEENIIGSSFAEEVVNRLECVKPIHLMGYESSYNLKYYSPNYEQEAFQSGYSYLLKGRVSRRGDNFSFEIMMSDSVGIVAWSKKYEKSLSGLADLPREISKDIVEGFDIEDEDYSLGFLAPRTNINTDSYLLYLRGLEMLHRKTQEKYENAYLLFLQAIQQDPKFSEGLAAAAYVLESMLDKGWSRGDSVFVQSVHLAEAAIKSNPLLYRGYYTLGKLFTHKKEYLKALANLDSALNLAPSNALIYFETGKIYLKVGKFNDAINAFLQALKLNAYNPEVLQTIALSYQLAGMPWKSMQYHEAAVQCVNDSLTYLTGPFTNTILSNPDLRLKHSNRVIAACFRLINSNSKDYKILYQLAHLRQVMGDVEGDYMLRRTESNLLELLKADPKNARALAYLALTLTRLGRFSQAIVIANRALEIDSMDAGIKYNVAQMFSIQMYSQKEGKFDEKKKDFALKYLKEALELNYQLDELTSADFYNMFDRAEFKSLIIEQLK